MSDPRSRARLAALVLTILVAGPVAAHAQLTDSDPSAGETVVTSPTEVRATFDELIDPARSSMSVRDAAGTVIAEGSVDPTDARSRRMVVALPSPLAPGTYDVRWTAVTPDDDGIERGRFAFTVAGAAVTPRPSAGPSLTATAGPTEDASPPPASGSTAGPEPSAMRTATPSADSSPAPSAVTGPATGDASRDQALIPVAVAGILGALAAAWLIRRRSAA